MVGGAGGSGGRGGGRTPAGSSSTVGIMDHQRRRGGATGASRLPRTGRRFTAGPHVVLRFLPVSHVWLLSMAHPPTHPVATDVVDTPGQRRRRAGLTRARGFGRSLGVLATGLAVVFGVFMAHEHPAGSSTATAATTATTAVARTSSSGSRATTSTTSAAGSGSGSGESADDTTTTTAPALSSSGSTSSVSSSAGSATVVSGGSGR